MPSDLIRATDIGLYCPPGDFYVDPWRPVDKAVVTHAHGDHLTRGCGRYLVSEEGARVTRVRLDSEAVVETLPYGRSITQNGVTISLHPAGHILGSAQVRLEYKGHVAVVSGDYKVEPDPTTTPFEVVPCHTFVTESTFGLPIYHWPSADGVRRRMNAWWAANRDAGRASIVFAYALGKAQRVLAMLDPATGPIYTHGAVERLNTAYRETGIDLPPTTYATAERGKDWGGAMVVAPPSAHGSTWIRRFGDASTAFASGWMTVRGRRRRRGVDRGFVVSDHVDWTGLTETIRATGCERLLVTHGSVDSVVRWAREQGLDAHPLPTRYSGELEDSTEDDSETAEE